LAGGSIDEIAFLLGQRDVNVTRAVYVRELADTAAVDEAIPDDRRVRGAVPPVAGS
jgi:hypothetical protein